MIFVTAIDAQEFRLCLPIVFRYMSAGRARLACMVRRNGQQHAAVPNYLIRQLASELAPSLIENGTVQARFLRYLFAGLFAIAFGRPGHIPYLQILNADERVALADRRCGFVQEVFAGVSDVGVNLLDASLRLLRRLFHRAARSCS